MSIPLPLWAETLAVFDTETTGIDTEQSRIVSSTIAILDSTGEVQERYDWLIDPGIEIPLAAARVHGISTEVARASGVAAQIGVQQICSRLLSMFDRGYPVVAFNAAYDFSIVRAEAQRHAIAWPDSVAPVIDPLILDRQLDRFRKGKRTLEVVSQHYGVSLMNSHDAGEDAIAAGRVAQAIARKYSTVLPDQLIELHNAQVTWAAAQAENFQQYMRRVKDANFIADGTWPMR